MSTSTYPAVSPMHVPELTDTNETRSPRTETEAKAVTRDETPRTLLQRLDAFFGRRIL